MGYWKSHLGGVALDKITPVMVKAYREKRLRQGIKARTLNIETVTFYAVLKYAVDCGVIASFPRVPQLKQKPPPIRQLLSPQDVGRLLTHCKAEVTKNASLLAFYLRFLALSGGREKESLRIQWADVDFQNWQLTIGSDGSAKMRRFGA